MLVGSRYALDLDLAQFLLRHLPSGTMLVGSRYALDLDLAQFLLRHLPSGRAPRRINDLIVDTVHSTLAQKPRWSQRSSASTCDDIILAWLLATPVIVSVP